MPVGIRSCSPPPRTPDELLRLSARLGQAWEARCAQCSPAAVSVSVIEAQPHRVHSLDPPGSVIRHDARRLEALVHRAGSLTRDDATTFEHQNLVGSAQRGGAMRDHQAGDVAAAGEQALPQFGFSLGVEC